MTMLEDFRCVEPVHPLQATVGGHHDWESCQQEAGAAPQFTSLAARLTSKLSTRVLAVTGREPGVLAASSRAPSSPPLLGSLSTWMCLSLLREDFSKTRSLPNRTTILICHRQQVPLGRNLQPDQARACRMDFF